MSLGEKQRDYPLVYISTHGECIGNLPVSDGFYTLSFINARCEYGQYGCSRYDFRAASLIFKSPHAKTTEPVIADRRNEPECIEIHFAPELFTAERLDDYHFFEYNENESLHLSEREVRRFMTILAMLGKELHHKPDAVSSRQVVVHTELLLDHCRRFYERQFILRNNLNKAIMDDIRSRTEAYWKSESGMKDEDVLLGNIRQSIPHSMAYIDDLLRIECGHTLPEYTELIRLELAEKQILYSDKPLSEIADNLGYENWQSMCFLFRKMFGCPPIRYRLSFKNRTN